MKISDALSQARQDLDSKGVGNSRLDSLILLAHTLSFSKEQIIFNPDLELSPSQQQSFFELIARRKNREPVSQIIGRREFFGEDFIVSKDVLDPRPDSESLIELVLKNFPQKERKLKILELGVGSGCLIITLLKAYQEAVGVGLDISEAALKIARKNAEFHDVQDRLELYESDLFAIFVGPDPRVRPFANSDSCRSTGGHAGPPLQFDLIISNPPYIPTQDIEELQPEVKTHEPRSALDGGLDGLDFYRRIAAEAKSFLNENGQIILEIGFDQKEKVIEIFTEKEFLFSDLKLDLSGITRALCFKIKS